MQTSNRGITVIGLLNERGARGERALEKFLGVCLLERGDHDTSAVSYRVQSADLLIPMGLSTFVSIQDLFCNRV